MKLPVLSPFLGLVLTLSAVIPILGATYTPDDLTKVVRVTDPQLSPNGSTVAVLVGRANLRDDRWDADLVVVDVASQQVRVVTHGRLGTNSPRWSPKGDMIAYVAQDPDKKGQVFVLPMAGGDSVQITHSKTGVTVPAWSPDGRFIAYAAADDEPERKDQARFEDAFEVGDNDFLQHSRAQPVHIWTIPSAGGEAHRVTTGSDSLPIEFLPGGPPPQITWARSPLTGDSDSTIRTVDVASGTVRSLTGASDFESNPVLSPDGTQVAYSYPRDGKPRNTEEAFVAPLTGGKGVDVSRALDRNLGWICWAADSRSLILVANEETHVGCWLQPIGGTARSLDLGKLVPKGDFFVGSTGGMVFTATTEDHASELYYMSSADSAPVQLTHLQVDEQGMELGRNETIGWNSDAFKVYGVVTYPPHFVAGKKYPLVLYIHGGPTATSLDSFTPAAQILAAQGWIVFQPNYRGSDNEGNAFLSAIVGDSGAGPGRDVMAGVEFLKKRGIVDESRIAVSGWSYGGYMTTWLLGNYPSVWKAAVAGAPVTDLVDQYSLSDTNVRRGIALGGSPFNDDRIALYRAQSPITYASKVRAPTLILADVGDWRVTITNAYKFYHALRDNGVATHFFAYPVTGHSPADPIRARDVYRRWVAWLGAYLK